MPLNSKQHNIIQIKKVHDWRPDWITISKLQLAFKGFHSKKSPGPDGIRPVVLKHFPVNMLQITLRLYKLSMLLSFTPSRWKDCKIIFIPKPGKPRYDIAKSWRPISLTNYLLKGLERLCGWKMDEALTEYPVHTYQHGFRTDRNTETAISGVVDYIERHIYNGKHVLAVFLDIQAAFDTTG